MILPGKYRLWFLYKGIKKIYLPGKASCSQVAALSHVSDSSGDEVSCG